MLYIVPTPIGNLKDITLRALEVLREVDGIICEDSRRTSILLNHYQINKPLYVLNDYNESRDYFKYLQMLQNGQNLALVSDAGTPLISDPGYKLVREVLAEGLDVDSLPGPVAAITSLTLSTLPPDKFLFLGYLPEKPGHRRDLLSKLIVIHNSIIVSYIIYVAPHKLVRTLEDLKVVLGDLEIVLATELTKIHQRVEKQTINQWLNKLKNHPPKGEYILLFHY